MVCQSWGKLLPISFVQATTNECEQKISRSMLELGHMGKPTPNLKSHSLSPGPTIRANIQMRKHRCGSKRGHPKYPNLATQAASSTLEQPEERRKPSAPCPPPPNLRNLEAWTPASFYVFVLEVKENEPECLRRSFQPSPGLSIIENVIS